MKNNNVRVAILFLSGMAAGSLITWRLLKTEYERKTQEQIDSVKEVFSRRQTKSTEPERKDTSENADRVIKEEHDRDIAKSNEILKECGYKSYSEKRE